MNKEKSEAVVLVAGHVVGRVSTSLKNGATAHYGQQLTSDGYLVKLGVGKISRARKHLLTSHEKTDLFVTANAWSEIEG